MRLPGRTSSDDQSEAKELACISHRGPRSCSYTSTSEVCCMEPIFLVCATMLLKAAESTWERKRSPSFEIYIRTKDYTTAGTVTDTAKDDAASRPQARMTMYDGS